ncbi:hypothetical protein DKX38_007000 [Salix brachista]|uniref:R13L1/DRL21-like LRR repeat region domain-containing protein n=1 Tax=Salix brachista TaxID=2182728 RepID=A0A5N5MPJ1_9ROSI|nr:hypothetical protein DKX38_007000 [Salix brachista]
MASATAVAIGGSFLAAFLQVLFDRMASREVLGFFKERKLNDRLLRKLKRVKEEMETKLGEIVDMLEYLVQQKNALGLREGAVEKASSQRIPTTSLVDESGVYGRDEDKEAIMKLVRSANENGKRLDQSNGKSRPVFQGSNGDPLFVMHDLINDLARYVSREFCFRLEGEDSNKISERTRHLSYAVTRHDACERFEGIYDAKLLRTFLPLSEALPHSIGNLKRLRYVTLKGTAIKKLPASMGGLCNLQTLILRSCKDLIELPDDMGRLINLSHLDIEGTKLSKMPQHMGKLTKLQNLSDFFLGKDTGSSIQELGKLQHLQGVLNIWNLQNVGTAPDALQDSVKGMKHLKTLNLMWDGDPNDSGHVRHVLDKLEPDVNMEYLYIYGYGGTRFSDWVGDSSFSRIVSMELSRCKYCTSLPPLGQLGSLKELMVRGFEGLAIVGREFYGSCTSVRKPFASLESLTLSMMPEWREWISDQGMQAFPCLQKLCISGCPYLRKVLSNHRLPSLTTLEIEGCRQLVTSFPRCPIIDEIKLDDGFRHLRLRRLPSGMHSLEVDRCYSTKSIPKEMEQIGCFLTTLEEIEMENCDSLKCFQLELFPRMKILRISKCSNLEFICEHEGPLEDLTSLHSLKIWECPKLESFPKGGLPASCLTELQLFDCADLKSLPEHMNSLLPSLEDLRLFLLPKLEVFPEGGLPSKLKSLYIEDCSKLIAARMQWSLQSLPSLSKFTVGVDENVESFPEEMLLPSTLASLEIWSLKTLKSLNYSGLQHLTSLEQLTITDCPNLQSMPGEGLPSSLSSIEIWRCPLLDQRSFHFYHERPVGETECLQVCHADIFPLLTFITQLQFLAIMSENFSSGCPSYLCHSLRYSDALRYSSCSSKCSINRLKNPSPLTVSVSHTRQHCLLARVTATFIRLWSLKNPERDADNIGGLQMLIGVAIRLVFHVLLLKKKLSANAVIATTLPVEDDQRMVRIHSVAILDRN